MKGNPLAIQLFDEQPHIRRSIRKVAMLVVHSNPLAEPGAGDAGGMTVYVRQMARTLAARGVEVDIFTRFDGTGPREADLYDGVKVIQVVGGPADLEKQQIAAHLPEFYCNLRSRVEAAGDRYDVIHSHYWLSGRVASKLSNSWNVPFIHTFHTLGRVKNDNLAPGDVPEPEGRLAGEVKVIADANAIVASTVEERTSLIELYAAHPEKISLIAPGVDHELFTPADTQEAKKALGLSGKKVLAFVGRLQPLKAADTAIRALAHLVEWGRVDLDEVRLLVVGGSSGASGASEPDRLKKLAADLGVIGSVAFYPAQPQQSLPDIYRAADVCLVPSHSESFGLVALEAQACGVPVVGSAVGGLKSIVKHGRTGYLVEPGAAEAFAERVWQVLSDEAVAASMSRLAVCSSSEFSWERSSAELFELYAYSPSTVSEPN
ncbi:MAG: glycosyltransferase [Actinomycetota bacterium]|nr:glycosyltransferase [Actinomycetota bacterium]